MSIAKVATSLDIYQGYTDFLIKLGVIIVAFLAPLKGLVLTLFVLVAIDLLTGLLAAFKKKKKITSAKLSRTVTKLFVYLITILLVKMVSDNIVLNVEIPLTSLVSSFIIITELQSVLENLNKMVRQPFLKVLIDKLSLVTKGRHIH